MDTKLLLIRVITLLFLESLHSKKGNSSSRTLAEEVLKYIKPPETVVMADFSKDPTTKIRDILVWMVTQPIDTRFDRLELIQRLKLATDGEQHVYDAAVTYIESEITPDEAQAIIMSSRLDVNTFINKSIVTSLMKDHWMQAAYKPETVDWSIFVKDFINVLEPFKTLGEVDKSTLVETVDLTDIESLTAAIREGLSTLKPEGIIKFGWQGFNRLFGSQGGARRGEFIVVGALQSNFKSGTTLQMLKAAALYNKPYMIDPNKKPLLLRYSFENAAIIDIMNIYRSLIEEETGTKVKEDEVDPILAAIYMHEKLSVNGYKIHIEHHNPSDVTIATLEAMIEEWENKGYEIHMLNIDYLAMMSTKGCKQGAAGQDIRDLFRRTRNITNPKNITVVTPHQLSTAAKHKLRDGVEQGDFVREIATKGYWDSCSTIDQEYDFAVIQHLVKIGNETYVTWCLDKHRQAGTPAPFEHQYCVYKFGEVGFIPDDIFGVDLSRKRVAANTAAAGGESAWWDDKVAA